MRDSRTGCLLSVAHLQSHNHHQRRRQGQWSVPALRNHRARRTLILIEGLGTETWLWWKQVLELSRYFRVISYHLRGSSWSDKPDELYSIPMFADDLAGLMDALRIKQAHILGMSLGGYVALTRSFARTSV